MFPLLDIVPLENDENFEQKLSALTRYDWAIFISSNAVQNAMPRLLAKWGCIPQNLKFAAIGPATAAELTKFGVKQVLIPQDRFDSESLLTMPEMQSMQQQNVIIFRGVGGRELLGVTSLHAVQQWIMPNVISVLIRKRRQVVGWAVEASSIAGYCGHQ